MIPAEWKPYIAYAIGALAGVGFRIAFLRAKGKSSEQIAHDTITSFFALFGNVLIALWIAEKVTSDWTAKALVTALVVGSGIAVANVLLEKLIKRISKE